MPDRPSNRGLKPMSKMARRRLARLIHRVRPMSDHSASKDQMPSDDPMVHDGVSKADLDESLQMLRTRVGQVNAVFACFGSAAQHAQHFEAALAEFLSYYTQLTKRGVDPQKFEV